jgi:hypothetical protein
MDILVLIIFALLIILGLHILTSGREGFSLGQRDYRLCASVSEKDKNLMPHTIELVVQGYNYSQPLAVIRDGEEITPLQYAWNANEMSYYIVVYDPPGHHHEWILKTSDNVKPIVTEGYSQKSVLVQKRGKSGGYVWWSLSV